MAPRCDARARRTSARFSPLMPERRHDGQRGVVTERSEGVWIAIPGAKALPEALPGGADVIGENGGKHEEAVRLRGACEAL